jgi:preprotein translocase subunit SecD
MKQIRYLLWVFAFSVFTFSVFAGSAEAKNTEGDFRFQVGKAVLTAGAGDLTCVEVKFIFEQPGIAIKLSPKFAKKFGELTRRNIGKQMQIVRGGKVLQSAVIQTAITGGRIHISGRYSIAEAQDIARRLRGTEKNTDCPPPPSSKP